MDIDLDFAKFIVPRLRKLKRHCIKEEVFPHEVTTLKNWIKILNKMIEGFESYFYDDFNGNDMTLEQDEALELFSVWFNYLWY